MISSTPEEAAHNTRGIAMEFANWADWGNGANDANWPQAGWQRRAGGRHVWEVL